MKQQGIIGPWRPAFAMSFIIFAATNLAIFYNEYHGKQWCQFPNLINDRTYTFTALTVGATMGHFGLQVTRIISKFDNDDVVHHGSAQWMVLLITGIQAYGQMLMFLYRDRHMVCGDYFGVRTSVFLWMEWLSTVPIMFYLTAIMDVNKLKLSTHDKLVVFFALGGLVCLFALNFTTNYYLGVVLMTTANVIMTYALFWLHGGSYLQHLRAIEDAKRSGDTNPLTALAIGVKKRKLVCAGFMNYFFTLFPVAYYLKTIDVLDHDTMFMAFCFLGFLAKGIFATLVTESHTELLDPKTFLLFSEKAKAEEARRAFMKYMFEEVRVPLKSVTLGIELLRHSDALQGADKETVSMMKDAGDYMTETLNDVLAIQKIDEGKMTLDMKPFHVVDLLSATTSKSEGLCAKKGLRISYGMDSDVPPVVVGDRPRLEQVISTLIQTTVQHSDSGDISVSVSFSSRVRGHVTFSVKGGAPGIPLYDQKNLFRHVSQIRPEELQMGKGSGMGLAICTDIVNLHGGSIACDSTGCELYFNIVMEHGEDDMVEGENESAEERSGKYPLDALPVPVHLQGMGLDG